MPGPAGPPDPLILEEFADDYGNRFTITATEWFQQPRSPYHIVREQELGETQERLDFTKRLRAQDKGVNRLGPEHQLQGLRTPCPHRVASAPGTPTPNM